jgi:hypothetical protein
MPLRPCKECQTFVSSSARVCPHCGVRNPIKRRRLGIARTVCLVFATGFASIVFFGLNYINFSVPLSLPECGSDSAKDALKSAIEGSPISKIMTVTVFGVTSPKQSSYIKSPSEKRACVANVMLNSGKKDFDYTIEWADKDKGTFWIQTSFDQ